MTKPKKVLIETQPRFCEFEVEPHIMCGILLTNTQAQWCSEHPELFDGKYLCFNHQQKYVKNK